MGLESDTLSCRLSLPPASLATSGKLLSLFEYQLSLCETQVLYFVLGGSHELMHGQDRGHCAQHMAQTCCYLPGERGQKHFPLLQEHPGCKSQPTLGQERIILIIQRCMVFTKGIRKGLLNSSYTCRLPSPFTNH